MLQGALLLESEWGQYPLPVEKCSAKPTPFGVATNRSRSHSGVTFCRGLGTVSPAESGVVFLFAATEKAFPLAGSSMVYRC